MDVLIAINVLWILLSVKAKDRSEKNITDDAKVRKRLLLQIFAVERFSRILQNLFSWFAYFE